MFISKSEQLGALTLRHAVPAVTQFREFAAAGGLMSYGPGNVTERPRLPHGDATRSNVIESQIEIPPWGAKVHVDFEFEA